MKDLELNELKEVKGGAVSPWVFVGIGAILAFAVGAIDGYVRPLRCNKRK